MTNSTLRLTLAALAIAAGFGVAEAQERRQGPSAMGFESLDVDGSGEIDIQDLDAARAMRFADLDSNGDGQISEAEFIAHMQARASERATEMFARLDADGDGVVSRDALEARQGGGRGGERMLRRADTDGSGGVSVEEFEAFREQMADHRGGKRGKRGG